CIQSRTCRATSRPYGWHPSDGVDGRTQPGLGVLHPGDDVRPVLPLDDLRAEQTHFGPAALVLRQLVKEHLTAEPLHDLRLAVSEHMPPGGVPRGVRVFEVDPGAAAEPGEGHVPADPAHTCGHAVPVGPDPGGALLPAVLAGDLAELGPEQHVQL